MFHRNALPACGLTRAFALLMATLLWYVVDKPTAIAQDSQSAAGSASSINRPPGNEFATMRTELRALRRAVADLTTTFGARYPKGSEFLAELAELDQRLAEGMDPDWPADRADREIRRLREGISELRRAALLANPHLDFDSLLLVRRGAGAPNLGLPMNWQGNSSLPTTGYDDQIVTLSPISADGVLTTVFAPSHGRFVGDLDLNFDGQRILFSMPDERGRWQVYEIHVDGSAPRQLTGEEPDVDCYDACYLPSGKIIFSSTACFAGVPCVYGDSHVANLYVMDADGSAIRQLCFDQEHNWCPTVLPDGRVLYARWEYTDTPHSNTRLLFQMNPDGTEQRAFHGASSYWPNSFFYARPIPGQSNQFVSVIGGHHDHPRMGELVLFDIAKGRQEADGVVQRIPGYGQPVEPLIRDGLTKDSWPKFLHPFPLSDKYFLVSCKPSPQSLWGIYLVDVFDNLTLVKELPGYALFEPIPLRPSPPPPVIADTVDEADTTAMIYIPDVYAGDALAGIPRNTVKQLRVFSYHYAYQGMGGLLGTIGMDGPWDIKRVIGTVPVYDDGSAKFNVPANTPISLQPLDADGKAVQLMRSWMTAMPGEVVTCSGCHQRQNAAPRPSSTLAQTMPPVPITPWHGPTRGFSYSREVQPVIDRYCVTCHNGQPSADGSPIDDLRGTVMVDDWSSVTPGNGGYSGAAGKFSVGYAALHRYVRRPGIESDLHVLEPMEYHADTTHLVQLLKKGHHGVELDRQAWDRLVTWIDLNCPYHGTWSEDLDDPGPQRQRRRELLRRYGGIDDDPEAIPQRETTSTAPNGQARAPAPNSQPASRRAESNAVPEISAPRDASAHEILHRQIDLGEGISLQLTWIPAGAFIMGSADGASDERPTACKRIERPYWIGSFEITNAQFARFDPGHDSRVESKNAYQFGIHGYPVNRPKQPVVRVSWNESLAFCRWLSERTGQHFSLPTEAQWEYACRAGTSSPLAYGDLNADFSRHANLADAKLSDFASDPYTVDTRLANPSPFDDWIPKDARFNDGSLVSVAPGQYEPNAWGLFDMHGNVSEWTRSAYRAYPYDPTDGREATSATGDKVVRGGSWRDVPRRATSSYRLAYAPYQRVYNVGFRVVCETSGDPTVSHASNAVHRQ